MYQKIKEEKNPFECVRVNERQLTTAGEPSSVKLGRVIK